MTLGIPRTLAHIWVGDRKPPDPWMVTWRERHPDWEYILYDNAFLTSRRWRNQSLINEYFRRGAYAGVADLIRYEILYEKGGFIPEADSECLAPCDDLFCDPTAYTVYENETRKPDLVSPFLASVPGHPFLGYIIDDLGKRWRPETLLAPWRSTGNRYLKFRIMDKRPEITIFPSHYFIPDHKLGLSYRGDGPVYARQHWGTTTDAYEKPSAEEAASIRSSVLAELEAHSAAG